MPQIIAAICQALIIGAAIFQVTRIVRTPKRARFQGIYTCYSPPDRRTPANRYVFRLKRMRDRSYRCYILHTPSYRGRPTNGNVAHYLADSQGKYICYTAKLYHLSQAKTLCQQWSDRTQRYIETGKNFFAK